MMNMLIVVYYGGLGVVIDIGVVFYGNIEFRFGVGGGKRWKRIYLYYFS